MRPEKWKGCKKYIWLHLWCNQKFHSSSVTKAAKVVAGDIGFICILMLTFIRKKYISFMKLAVLYMQQIVEKDGNHAHAFHFLFECITMLQLFNTHLNGPNSLYFLGGYFKLAIVKNWAFSTKTCH